MPSTKPKQLLTFPLLWSIVLLLAPVPALGDIVSNTACTVGDSPDGDAVSLVPTCSANTVKLDVVFNEKDDSNIQVRVDYVCIGNGNEMLVGTVWDTPVQFVRDPFQSRNESVGGLQPAMNCTFYVCYRRFMRQEPYYIFGKGTASCITDIHECETANGGCEQTCTNTIGSFFCSCDMGYQLDGNGLNCTDIDECERGNTTNCHENAQCIDTEGSFYCSCNPGYMGDGVNCTNIDECELGMHTCHSNASCTDTVGSFSCTCIDGFEGDGFICTVLSSPGVRILPVVLVPTVLVVIFIALLCGLICVVYQLKKEVKNTTKNNTIVDLEEVDSI